MISKAEDRTWDCIVVGAGPAGLNAALVLGRARRRVLVVDTGRPRNYATHEMHGVLGHDGLDPADLRARGRAELAAHGVEVVNAEVQDAGMSCVAGPVEHEVTGTMRLAGRSATIAACLATTANRSVSSSAKGSPPMPSRPGSVRRRARSPRSKPT